MPTFDPLALQVFVVGDDHSVEVFPPGTGVSTIEQLVVKLNQYLAPDGLQFTFDVSKDFQEIR